MKIKKNNLMKKSILFGTIIAITLTTSLSGYAAAWQTGFDGINNYNTCGFGNRAGASYVEALKTELAASNSSYSVVPMPNNFINKDNSALESDINTYANSVEFYAFAGHGLNMTARLGSSSLYNSAHFSTMNNSSTFHDTSNEYDSRSNFNTGEAQWGGNLLVANMYCCNWLTNDGNASKQTYIFNGFKGTNLLMGFSSVMYLDSREGKLLGYYLRKGNTYKNSFLSAARYYQTQRSDGDTIARVIGYTSSANDTMTARQGARPSSQWYTNSPSLYSTIISETIPHNGQTKPVYPY